MGVRTPLRLQGYAWAYYVNLFTAHMPTSNTGYYTKSHNNLHRCSRVHPQRLLSHHVKVLQLMWGIVHGLVLYGYRAEHKEHSSTQHGEGLFPHIFQPTWYDSSSLDKVYSVELPSWYNTVYAYIFLVLKFYRLQIGSIFAKYIFLMLGTNRHGVDHLVPGYLHN